MRLLWPFLLISFTLCIGLSTASAQDGDTRHRPIITPENSSQVEQIARFGSGVFTSAAAYNASTRQIAVGGSLGLWLYAENHLEAAPDFIDLDRPVIDVVYSPDGRYLAYTTADGGVVLDAATYETLFEIPDAQRIAFRPQTTELMVVTRKYDPEVMYFPITAFQRWDVARGEQLSDTPQVSNQPDSEITGAISHIEYSPDGRYFAANFRGYAMDSCNDFFASVAVWDANNLAQEPVWLSDVLTFAFHPTEPVIAAAYHSSYGIGTGGSVILWNYQTLTETQLAVLGADSDSFFEHDIQNIAFTADGSAFSALTPDHAWTWRYPGLVSVEALDFDPDWSRFVGYAPLPHIDRWLTIESDRLTLGNLGAPPVATAVLPNTLRGLSIAPSGAGLTSLSPSGERRIWRLAAGQMQLLATVPPDVEVLLGGSRAAYADDRGIHVLDLATGAVALDLPLSTPVLGMVLNDAGTFLAFRTADSAELWELERGLQSRDLMSNEFGARFAPESFQAFGFVSESSVLWVRSSGPYRGNQISLIQPNGRIDDFGGYPNDVQIAVSPQLDYFFFSRAITISFAITYITDGFYLDPQFGIRYAGSFEGVAVDFSHETTFFSTLPGNSFMSTATVIAMRSVPDFTAVVSSVWYGGSTLNSAASNVISPDGTHILAFEESMTGCGGDYHFVTLWDVAAETPILYREQPFRSPAAFSPDSAVFTLSTYNRVNLYAALDGRRLTDLPANHSDQITTSRFSPDGSVLYSGSADGTLRVWGLGNAAGD